MRLAHHIVWEAANGPIPEGYQIHHIDHDKWNNDLENLQLVTGSEHQRLHSKYCVKLDGAWLKVCADCKNVGPLRLQKYCDSCRARRARIERRQLKTKISF